MNDRTGGKKDIADLGHIEFMMSVRHLSKKFPTFGKKCETDAGDKNLQIIGLKEIDKRLFLV